MNTRGRFVFPWMFVIGLAGCTSPAPPQQPVPQSAATNAPTVLPSAPEPMPSAPVPSVSASVSPVPIASALAPTETPSPPRVVVCMDCNSQPIIQYAHFDHQQSKILKSSWPVLETVVQVLKEHPDIRVEIRGHIDASEVRPGVGKLGLNRAEAVKKWLVEKGIDPARLSAKDYGDTQPLAVPHAEKDRAINRRVEFKKTP